MSNQALERLHELDEVLEHLTFVDDFDGRGPAATHRRTCLLLLRMKVLFEAAGIRPILVVVSGGTNVGKSTVFNQLAGVAVSFVSPLARGTKCPVAWGESNTLHALIRSPFVPEVTIAWETKTAGALEPDRPTMLLRPAERDFHPGLVMIDSPDLDSDHRNNRVWAERLLFMSDAVVLVVTPEKYNDAVGVEFLAKTVSLHRSVAIVFNKAENDTAVVDFERNILRPHDKDSPVFRQGIFEGGESSMQPLPRLEDQLQHWAHSARSIKMRSVEGSLSELAKAATELLGLFWKEQSRLADVHESLNNAVDGVVGQHRVQLEGQKFQELDLVFKRLLADLRIPVVDDFYGGVKAVGTALWSRIGGFIRAGRDTETKRDRRRFEERQRVLEAARQCRIHISRALEAPKGFSRELVTTWIRHIPDVPTGNAIDEYLDDVDRAVQAWTREETLAITRRLRDKPGFRSFLIGAKAVVQLGSGVAGALLTGGIHPSDLAVIPAVERMTAFLIERGLGYSYFARCRTRLLSVRGAVLASFLRSRLLEPLQSAIPAGDQETARRLERAIEQLPNAEGFAQ